MNAGTANLLAATQRFRDEIEHLASEYQFMRSFGMSHDKACERIGQDPYTFRVRMERNNLTVPTT